MRGQSYDNAANSEYERYTLGFKPEYKMTILLLSTCTAHSLNLVETRAAENYPEAMKFFELIQELYNLFSESTQCWYIY